MAQHQHVSPYHDVFNVQMIASPHFNIPQAILPPYDLHALPQDLSQRRFHDFALEHRIVQEYERIAAQEEAQKTAKEEAYQNYVRERDVRLKKEKMARARKIAPGFLDTEDRRILTPTLVQATSATASNAHANKKPGFDYREFETQDDDDSEELEASTAAVVGPTRNDDSGNDDADPAGDRNPRGRVASPTGNHSGTENIARAIPLSSLSLNATSPTNKHVHSIEKSFSQGSAQLDFREFEQGLGPPDPWDTPVNDLAELEDIISQQMGQVTPSKQQQQQQQQTFQSISVQARSMPAPQAQSIMQKQPHQQQTQQPQNQQYPSNPTAYYQQQYKSSPSSMHSTQQSQLGDSQSQGGYTSTQSSYQQQHRSTPNNLSQQHQGRFGAGSPTPPPLPPPPRGHTESPSNVGTGMSSPQSVQQQLQTTSSRPQLPARPAEVIAAAAAAAITNNKPTNQPPPPPLMPRPPRQFTNPQGANSVMSTSSPPTNMSYMPGNSIKPGGGGPTPPPLPPPPSSRDQSGGAPASSTSPSLVPPPTMTSTEIRAQASIEQLLNMGFTREQSIEALEKYDYDLEKATNHLLDWG